VHTLLHVFVFAGAAKRVDQPYFGVRKDL
jgi:hypothetical protein